MKTKVVAIRETGWKWVLVGIGSLVILAAGYSFSQAMGMGGFGGGWGHMGGSGYSSMDHMGQNRYKNPMMDYERSYNRNSRDDQRLFDRRNGWPTSATPKITAEEAGDIVRGRVSDNPNLKVGQITDTEDGFMLQDVTKKGEALVDQLLVEKDTGRIYRVYE